MKPWSAQYLGSYCWEAETGRDALRYDLVTVPLEAFRLRQAEPRLGSPGLRGQTLGAVSAS